MGNIKEIFKKYTMVFVLILVILLFTIGTGGKMLLPANINNLIAQNAYVFVVFYTFAYVGIAIFSLITWAMITDVIDDAQVHDGRRSDGTIYSVYSFARKVGQAASSGVAGLLLSIIGYSQATAFEPSVVNGIYHITCLAPAVGFVLLALSLAFLYPLNRKKVQENARILVEKENEAK